jgi:hypothetical protein
MLPTAKTIKEIRNAPKMAVNIAVNLPNIV